jgi:hypothetical protein
MNGFLPLVLRWLRVLLRCNLFKAMLLLLALWMAACARLPVTGKLPEGMKVERSAAITDGAPFAADPTRERIALGREGLRLWTPATGAETRLDATTPSALAWSPAGDRLAAAFPRAGETAVRLLDPAGRPGEETVVAGEVHRICWLPGDGLLFAATTLKVYSFGGGFSLTLFRWDGRGAPQATSLHEVTLKPLTLRQWGGVIHRTPGLALSPLGDEILYARLHDPPAFSPYLKLIVRHLETGGERVVASVPLPGATAVFAPDGETVLYGDGRQVHTVEAWTGREGESRPTPGAAIALSPAGEWLLLDDRLYREGAEAAVFAEPCAGAFAPGGRLLLRCGGRLHLLSGLVEEAPAPPAVRERLLLLRKWRASGLITPDEYLEQKSRILP